MKTEKELNEEILKLRMKIEEQFPELSKYISEMPVYTSDIDTEETKIENLQSYYESLNMMLKNYAINHHKGVSK